MTDIDKLLNIMRDLRNPDSGCPWDLEQTFATVAPYTIEEAYEVQEAILQKDHEGLCQELGDLLLQVVFHAQMAEEQGLFSFADVVEAITSKMVRRHPHVFGDVQYESMEQQKQDWERMKREEQAGKSVQDQGLLSAVPHGLPALKRAHEVQQKAAAVGFDWSEWQPVVSKIEEEISELRDAVESQQHEHIQEELGDILFTVVNLARKLEVDAEYALHQSNLKFTDRFHHLEKLLAAQNLTWEQASIDDLEVLWQQAKAEVGTDQQ